MLEVLKKLRLVLLELKRRLMMGIKIMRKIIVLVMKKWVEMLKRSRGFFILVLNLNEG